MKIVQIMMVIAIGVLFLAEKSTLKWFIVALLAALLVVHFWELIAAWAKPELGKIESDVQKKL